HDAAEIEARGAPVAVLGTDAFASLAEAAAAALGVPHLRLVAVPHPLGGIDPKLARAKADDAVDRVIAALTRDPAPPALTSATPTPIARCLAINAGANALGRGHRANAVIGRAVRLTLQNIGGARPGREDRATLGHPGKYSYCLAENEAESPWAPLHVERGFGATESCVTVCGSEAPHNVNDHGSTSAEALLFAIAGTAATTGSNDVYLGGEPLVVLGPEHARTFADSGWSKADVKRAIWERARVRLDRF